MVVVVGDANPGRATTAGNTYEKLLDERVSPCMRPLFTPSKDSLGEGMLLTGHDIRRIHGVIVLDEAKAIHQLHLGNGAGAMSLEVLEDIFLCH